MEKLLVNNSEVLIGRGIDFNAEISGYNKIFIVSDSNVAPLYLDKIKHNNSYVIKAGEKRKTYLTYLSIINKLNKKNYTKNDLIISLGGGVVSDIVGYVASTYKRGMKYICIPTSILSMVDASIGGKNGVNFFRYKNVLGSFYNPVKTIIDLDFLKTLSKREYNSGLAEIVKYGAIYDKDLFNRINNEVNEDIIKRCIEIKKYFVEKDFLDQGERKALNFGHTFGHAIESQTKFRTLHGEAVAKGMVLISSFAEKFSLSIPGTSKIIQDKLNSIGIESMYDGEISELTSYIRKDKKVKERKIDIVVVPEIGTHKIVNLDLDLIK